MYEALLVKASKDGKLSDKALADVRAVQPHAVARLLHRTSIVK